MLSYIVPAVTASEATSYLSAAVITGWPVATDDQEAAIMRGQRALAALYNGRWLTKWENSDAPDAVKFAIAEAALVEAKTPGTLSAVDPGKVLTTAGKLSWTITKATANTVTGKLPDVIGGLLADLVAPRGANVPLVRF